jgi:hypothetical protein
MKKIRFLQLFFLLLAVQLAVAQNGMQRYEYWIDNDYNSRTIKQSSQEDITFTIDVSLISSGIHYFNVRGQASNGQWGALSRYLVYIAESGTGTNSQTDYEYWLDNDYTHRVLVEETSVPEAISLDVSSIPPGLHYFNFRAKSSGGQWGGLSRFMVYLAESGKESEAMAGYEYWLDNDYAGRTQQMGSHAPSAITLDMSTMYPGVHYFNFRARTLSGQWGALHRYLIYVPQPKTKLKNIEYWIDDDKANSMKVDVANNDSIVITVDLADITYGTHSFNVLSQASDGSWCLPACYEFSLGQLPTVPTPKVSHNGNTITIEDADNVDTDYPIEYHYTLDGTTPTRHSTLYEGPFDALRNGTLRVIGVQYAHENSEIAELVINWFKVAKPTFAQVGNTLTIKSDTTQATIYYKIGNGEEIVYNAPIRLSDRTKVTAIGRYDGYYDSEVATYQPRDVKCIMPTASYDGRYLKIQSNEGGVSFYYTLDGSSPADGLDVAESAKAYNGRITIESLTTLRAVAIIDSMNVSDVLEYPIKYLYDGNTTYVSEDGLLSNAYEWCGGIKTIENIKVVGPLNNTDLDTLCSVPGLAHVDLSEASLTSRQIPSDAFAGSQIVSFISPTDIRDGGGRMFADCTRLAAVVWNAETALKTNTFEGVNNPNLIVYVKNDNLKPEGIDNVVVDGVAARINLSDLSEGNNNFYCPKSFKATDISYMHKYKQRTAIGICRGWETLVLPFDVGEITHETNGTLTPFYAEGDGMPFWLMELSADSLEFAHSIVANKPYIICMPNNPDVYSDAYNQAGNVTFAAHDVVIPVTTLSDTHGAGVTIRPVYQTVTRSEKVYALNVGEARGDNPEGSVFEKDYRDVRPFEVYMLPSSNAARFICISGLLNGGNGYTSIEDVMLRKDRGTNEIVRVYSLSGALIKQGKRGEVLKNLPRGIYIVDGKKIIK